MSLTRAPGSHDKADPPDHPGLSSDLAADDSLWICYLLDMILLQRGSNKTFSPHNNVVIPEGGFLIGRGRGCHLVIPDGRVARRHCRIWQTDHGLFIEDLVSTNGTFVNYQKIQRQPLSFGARIEPERHCLYLFQEPPDDLEVLRQRAAQSDAPSEELASLSGYYDPELLRSLAKNPNTPPKTLGNLAGLYPEAVWQNPLMSLLLLSNPMLSDLAPGAICELLTAPELSPQLLEHFSSHEEPAIRLAVASHSKTPGPVLQQLLHWEQGYHLPLFMKTLVNHPNFQRDWLVNLCRTASSQTKLLLVNSIDPLPEYAYQLLSTDADVQVRLAVTRCSHVPFVLRRAVIKGADSSLDDLLFQHRVLAQNIHLQIAFLQGHNEEARLRLLQSGILEASLIEQFFSDESAHVRLAAVDFVKQLQGERRGDLLWRFLQDKDPAVRQAAQEAREAL